MNIRHFVHGRLREWYLSRVARALYETKPINGWSWRQFKEQQQIGNPVADIYHNTIDVESSAALAALVWRKP